MQVADLLLQGGANVDKTGGLLKGTALHRATELNQPDLIEYLLRNGASLEIRDSQVCLYLILRFDIIMPGGCVLPLSCLFSHINLNLS